MRVAPPITLSDGEREALDHWARGRRTAVRLSQRAQMVLQAALGKQNDQIAMEIGVTNNTVGRWRSRFAEGRLAGIEKDASRSGRRPTRRQELASLIIAKTTKEKPPDATHWSTRSLSKAMGCSRCMVNRVWRAAGLKPHLWRTFKLSNDPHFEEKLRDVVGLNLNPPEHSMVVCADEKSQIQALDRTQKSLPMYPGRCGTLTHDYKRNGTTSLFAAIDMVEGKIIGTCMPRHRHQEWLKFLNLIDERVKKDLTIHLICDNYQTHKHEKVRRWINRHPRFQVHFIPTSSSWLNLIERWFREITDKRIRRGVFKSVPQLIDAIMNYIERHNGDPKPFVWTAKAEEILEKVRRARATLDNLQSE